MKIELNVFVLLLLSLIPCFFVFVAVVLKTKVLDKKVKDLEQEILINNGTMLDLEKEIVDSQKTNEVLQASKDSFIKLACSNVTY